MMIQRPLSKIGVAALNALEFVLDSPEAEGIISQVGDSNILIVSHGWVDQRQTEFAGLVAQQSEPPKNAI